MYLIALLTFVGLLIGLLISKYTIEEIKEGRKYFLIAYKILIFLTLIMSLYFAWFAYIPYMLIAFLAGVLIYFGISNPYFYLGILFVLGFWEKSNYFYIVAVLIFCIGLLRGGLIGEKFKKKKNVVKKIVISLIFFAIPFVLVFFRSSLYLGIDNIIFAFISGSFFMEFIRKIHL
jgi:hypothetical protein